jgi:hypothetical protein
MSNGCISYFGSQLVAIIILEFLTGKLRAEIGDYAVRHTKTTNNPSDELDGGLSNKGFERLDLHPLCKLVNGDQ